MYDHGLPGPQEQSVGCLGGDASLLIEYLVRTVGRSASLQVITDALAL